MPVSPCQRPTLLARIPEAHKASRSRSGRKAESHSGRNHSGSSYTHRLERHAASGCEGNGLCGRANLSNPLKVLTQYRGAPASGESIIQMSFGHGLFWECGQRGLALLVASPKANQARRVILRASIPARRGCERDAWNSELRLRLTTRSRCHLTRTR